MRDETGLILLVILVLFGFPGSVPGVMGLSWTGNRLQVQVGMSSRTTDVPVIGHVVLNTRWGPLFVRVHCCRIAFRTAFPRLTDQSLAEFALPSLAAVRRWFCSGKFPVRIGN